MTRPKDIEEIKDVPFDRRSVTQLVMGLEVMLENVTEYKKNPEVVKLIVPNYQRHVSQLKRLGESKMASFYERAYSHFERAYQ